MSARVKLGAWTLPSGNHVDVYLESDAGSAWRHATCEWASPPPLSAADERYYYLAVVLPALTRRTQEYRRPGHAMVLFT